MHQIIRKNWDKSKYLIISTVVIISLLLLTVVYRSNSRIVKKSMNTELVYENADLKTDTFLFE